MTNNIIYYIFIIGVASTPWIMLLVSTIKNKIRKRKEANTRAFLKEVREYAKTNKKVATILDEFNML